MDWIQMGLVDLQRRMGEIMQRMCDRDSVPEDPDWAELQSTMAFYHNLKTTGRSMGARSTPTAPIKAPVTAAPSKVIPASVPARTRLGLSREMLPAVGSRIRRLRATLGLTIADVATLSGVSASTICKIEIGDSLPFRQTFDAIAKALETTPELLMDVTPTEVPREEEAVLPSLEEAGIKATGSETIGTFQQTLRGGRLCLDNGSELYIFQSIVDRAGIRHGDRIRAEKAGNYDDGSIRFWYEVVESIGAENPDRAEAIGSAIRYDGYYMAVEIPEGKILFSGTDNRGARAAEGDAVTVAYWKKEIQQLGEVKGSLVRVHQGSESFGPSGQSSLAVIDSPVRTRPVQREVEEEQEATEQAPLFVGTPRVLIVGGRQWPHYRDGLTAMGAEPTHLPADGRRDLENLVRSHDIVIVVTTYMSHKLRLAVQAVAKNSEIVFYQTDRENWSGLSRFLCEQVLPAWNEKQAS